MIRSILSVVAGLVTTIVLVMIFSLMVVSVMLGGMDREPTMAYIIVNILYGALSALAGGYVTGWIAKQKILQHALALSALILLLGIPGLFAQAPSQPAWYPFVIMITGVAFSLAGGYFRNKQVNQA